MQYLLAEQDLRGIILENDHATDTQTITLQDNTDNSTLFQADVPNGDVFAMNIPEDGILFPGGMKVLQLQTLKPLID